MSFQKFQSSPARHRPSAPRKFFGFGKLIIFLGIVSGGGWLLFQQTVQSQLRDRIQEKINQDLSESGLAASLGQARFHEGQGIRLNNLVVELAGTKTGSRTQTRLEIYETFIHAPATLTQLASADLKIQAVEMRRAKLTLFRDADGKWDFEQVLDSLVQLQPDPKSPKPVSLIDCEISIVDQSSSRSTPIKIFDVDIFAQPIVHEGRPLIQVNGGFRTAAVSRIEFTTFLDKQTESWKATLGATDATLSHELVSLLTPEMQKELDSLNSVSGKINFEASATGRMSLDEIPNFHLKGNVAGLTIDDSRLPFPIRSVSANFETNNSGFSIENASGKLGQGDFSANYWQLGFLEREKWHCDGRIDNFNFDDSPRLKRWIPEKSKRFCREYSPLGTSNVDFDLSFDGTKLSRTINSELTNMSFSFFKLPYKVENCVGVIKFVDEACDFEVRSRAGKQEIKFTGLVRGLGKKPTFELNISVLGDLPIDQKMLDAIDVHPTFSKVVRAFSPTGRVTGIGKIEKQVPGGDVIKSFDVRLKQCSIRHDNFDYPIHNIDGLIQIRDHEFTFSDLRGNNSSGKVICNGTWNPTNGLNTRFLCSSIPLNDQLRFALKPDLREIWNGFRPRGTLDFMRVDMTLPIGQRHVDLVVEAKMERLQDEAEANYVSIHPVWFPYEINHVTGTVNIGNGAITLTDIKGQHQRTWIVSQGDGRYSEDAWSVKLKNLIVGRLKIDEDLLDAVPSSLAPPIRQLKYEGLVNVSGEISVGGTTRDKNSNQLGAYNANPSALQNNISSVHRVPYRTPRPPSTSLAWDLRFDMNQANMQIGIPIENVFGKVQLVGVYDGKNAECRGDLEIDSLTVYDAQITKIRGPIWLDNLRAGAGVFARPRQTNRVGNVSPIKNQKGEIESVTGQMHKGTVTFDAQMDSGAKNEFYVQATLADGCLATTCREFDSQMDDIEGHSFAAIRMTGDYSGIHSHRGEGIIQLRDAKIYELPVFLSLLKIPNFRQLSRTAFDSSNIDFTIHGDIIDFNRMEFLGDAISLIGNGKMNLDREIDLNFYSVVGRNKINIPLISELYRASSQKILWINVDGTLENPQTHPHVLPQLNDSLKQLFQPRERSGLANRFQQGFNGPGALSGLSTQPLGPVSRVADDASPSLINR